VVVDVLLLSTRYIILSTVKLLINAGFPVDAGSFQQHVQMNAVSPISAGVSDHWEVGNQLQGVTDIIVPVT